MKGDAMSGESVFFDKDWGAASVDFDRARATRKYVDQFLSRSNKPKYDCVVVAGNGIGALCFAGRLARSAEFQGKVTLIAPPIKESRRLIDGVSLRGRAADYISAALGVTHKQLIQQITGDDTGKADCHRVKATMAYPKNGGWECAKDAPWLGGGSGSDNPVIYGARNSRTTAGMWELMGDLGIEYIPSFVESTDQMRDHALGQNPLLVNVTYNPTLLGNQPPEKTSRKVCVVQAPFKVAANGLKAPMESGCGLAPLIRRDGIIDVGFVTPFSDPLSPKSSWYSIMARVVDERKGFDKEYELKVLTEELLQTAERYGLEVDDPEETMAAACVPGSSYQKPPRSAEGTLELKSTYYGGNPAYYADGMISAAMGGLLAAEAVIKGDDPQEVVWNAARKIRFHNYLWWIETTKMAFAVDMLMRTNVNLAMSYPHNWGFKNWASAA